MEFIKKYIDKQKKKSIWSKISDLLFIILIIGLLIPQSRTPIIVFIKQLTNFSPSVSSEDNYGELSSKDYMWTILDSKNNKHILENFSNKPILINFWATWCPPCIAEMPSLINLQNEFGDRVHFIFISQEETTTINQFLKDKNWELNSYRQFSLEPPLLSTTSLPTTYIIDKHGRIIVKESGNKKWDSDSVKSLLHELINDK